jgi:hypothetical protein
LARQGEAKKYWTNEAGFMMTENSNAGGASRLAGLIAIVAGAGSIALLALHPMDRAQSFAEVVGNEARGLTQDAIVHGGFIAVLALQLVCYGVFSRRLGEGLMQRAGFTFFAIGAAWLCLSMLFDGLVTPAVAARYVAQPDRIESARPLFVLIGAVVGRVMPLGLGFQAAAILSWSGAMFAAGRMAISASVSLILGALLAACVYLGAFAGMMMALMGSFLLLALWAMLAGTVMLSNK